MASLFSSIDHKKFHWSDIKTFFIRSQYNELLKLVTREYFKSPQYNSKPLSEPFQYDYPSNIPAKDPNGFPGFLNINRALTLAEWDEKCECESPHDTIREYVNEAPQPSSNKIVEINNEDERKNAIQNLKDVWKPFKYSLDAEYSLNPMIKELNQKINSDINNIEAIESIIKSFNNIKSENSKTPPGKISASWLNLLHNAINQVKCSFEKKDEILGSSDTGMMLKYFKAQEELTDQIKIFKGDPTPENAIALKNASTSFHHFYSYINIPTVQSKTDCLSQSYCHDIKPNYLCLPKFLYQRKIQNRHGDDGKNKMTSSEKINFLKFETTGLTVGALIWLYYYERMGIFKILGVLMDDYNYKGKYTISGGTEYAELMDMICTLHRVGISSNLRDRVCSYQRVLGVDIENNLGIESERNKGFMENFKKVMDHALEYYDAKRLAKAIQNTGEPKSSVATQTSILDAIRLLKEQFEPFQYGRNQINTFLGIAMVHATLCLLHMLRKEIGIPDQYDKPQEFVPAAYDLLVEKRQVTRNTTNRFIVYDNCASYGYRLLTDIELADIENFNISDAHSNLTVWLDDVEGVIEGYRSAYASIPDKAVEMV